jgi:hypothetical protein
MQSKMKKLLFDQILAVIIITGLALSGCSPTPQSADLPSEQLTTLPGEDVPITEESTTSPGMPDIKPGTSTSQSATNIQQTPTVLENVPSVTPGSTTTMVFSSTPDIRLLPEDWREWPVIPENISARALEIYLHGLELGNDPHAFSVAGDCQSLPDVMLGQFGDPNKYNLKPSEEYLQESIDYFEGSFSREGMAVRGGFTAASVLSPLHADPKFCKPGETPLGCEFRVHNPSILIISLEVWRDVRTIDRYGEYLRQIIDFSIDHGVLPILATKADMAESYRHIINPMVANLAYEYDIPLWNFWLAVQPLKHHGIDPDRDGFHISMDAWIVKSFTALEVLDFAWNTVQSGPDPVLTPTATTTSQPSPSPTTIPSTPTYVPTPTQLPICSQLVGCAVFSLTQSIQGNIESKGIFLFEIQTGEMVQVLDEDYSLQEISPDGQMMLVNQDTNLYISPLNGYAPQLISDNFFFWGERNVYWMKDGETIISILGEGTNTDIWKYQLSGGLWTRITDEAFNPIQLYPSVDVDRVYWEAGSCSGFGACQGEGVMITDVDSGSTEPMDGVIKPAFSPDDFHFAFMDPRYSYDAQQNMNFNLVIENLEKRLLTRRLIVFPPASGYQTRNQLEDYYWSPDGSQIMIFVDKYSSYFETTLEYHAFVFTLSNGFLKEYDEFIGIKPMASWAPDSQHLLFAFTEIIEQEVYEIHLNMFDLSTWLMKTYNPGELFMSTGYLYLDKLFWLQNSIEAYH